MENAIQKGFKVQALGVIIYVFVTMYLQLTIAGPDSMNILMPALIDKFNMPPGEIMGAISAVRLIGVISGIIAGALIMKMGYKKIGVPAIIVAGLAVSMMGRVDSWMGIMVIQTILTIITPVLMFIQGGLIANWFMRYKGIIFGIVTIAAPLSTATFTPIGMKIFLEVGFADFYAGLGYFIAFWGVLGIVAMKEKPEDHGFDPDGIAFTEEEKLEVEAIRAAERNTKSTWTIPRIVRCKEFWFVALAWGLIGGLMMAGIMSQVIPILTGAGIELDTALFLMSAMALGGMPLSYVWGWLDDKIGTPKANAVFSLAYLVGAAGFAFGGPDNLYLIYIALFCISLGVGGMPNLMPSLVAYVFGRDEFVNIYRWVNGIQVVMMSIGMTYLAVMNDMTGSYSASFITFIPLAALCGIFFLSIKKTYDPERMALEGTGKRAQGVGSYKKAES
ncbi:MFS transporter [Vibrio algarum]|uniref:MFS transporter n=1 Tax=Vibrio algarum TaxID=3020714 RepID=A0ABT4YV86_9VIBR|nr:MFS transporter [Vibrio sp. KJ40-1]MDB1125297.1 MFS transporter [Vibrio sp. KJ40-1]